MPLEAGKAVFLDRDGVINEVVYFPDFGLVDSPLNPTQFRLLPRVGEAVRLLNELGLKVIVVSNQPCVGKGKVTSRLFEGIRQKMQEGLKDAGAHLDGEYYCFHHPEARLAEFRVNCDCRKPKPGLLLRAATDLGLRLPSCFMVGDGLTDVRAGKAAGCKTILISRLKCELCRLMEDEGVKPDFIVRDLLDGCGIIEKEVEGQ